MMAHASIRVSFIVVVLVFCNSSALADFVQWKKSDGGNGHFYAGISVPSGVSWDEANAAAIAMGGHLVTLTSAEENEWVFEHIASNTDLWVAGSGMRLIGPYIGLFQDTNSPDYSEPSGGWTWVTGEKFVFDAWSANEPNDGSSFGPENWAHFWSDNNTPPIPAPFWNDTTIAGGPTDKVGFIVEMVPEPTGFWLPILGMTIAAARIRNRSRRKSTH